MPVSQHVNGLVLRSNLGELMRCDAAKVHEEARGHSDWKHIDERYLEGRRRHVLEELLGWHSGELHNLKKLAI